jgi:hypothetical protein
VSSPSLIGIKNPDGSLRMSFCLWYGYPAHHLPILSKVYNTEEMVSALVDKGSFSNLTREPTTMNVLSSGGRCFKDIQHLRDAGLGGWEERIHYVYIWIPGQSNAGGWVCAAVTLESDLMPLWADSILVELQQKHVFESDNEDFAMPLEQWIGEYFTVKPAEQVVRTVVNRLSKEEWLKQNYPEMSELPKWRFPGMVAA